MREKSNTCRSAQLHERMQAAIAPTITVHPAIAWLFAAPDDLKPELADDRTPVALDAVVLTLDAGRAVVASVPPGMLVAGAMTVVPPMTVYPSELLYALLTEPVCGRASVWLPMMAFTPLEPGAMVIGVVLPETTAELTLARMVAPPTTLDPDMVPPTMRGGAVIAAATAGRVTVSLPMIAID